MMRLLQTSLRCHRRTSILASSPLQNMLPTRQASTKSTTRRSKAKRAVENNRRQFLTPGFQPTAIVGDNVGFYQGSTFYEGVPPDTLPTLDASVILSPGQYCKKSSWSTSHHRHKGTKSGVDAAVRLVEARRALTEVVQHELQLIHEEGSSNNNNDEKKEMRTRKIYAIRGHGVPAGLLRQFVDVANDWLLRGPTSSSSMKPLSSPPSMKILFTNTPNSILLDQSQIKMIDSHGIAYTLHSLPTKWERDFEMYMVVMDRMGSRLASLAMMPPPFGVEDDFDYDEKANNVDGHLSDNNEDNTLGTGSIVTPSHLKHWTFTIMKGEALPLSLLPKSDASLGIGNWRDRTIRGMDEEKYVPNLTLEWVRKKNRNDNDCWNVNLFLQDSGASKNEHGGTGGPISLVFEGEYVAHI